MEKNEMRNEEMQAETVQEMAEGKKKKVIKTWKQELREWIVSLVAAVAIYFVITSFLFQIIRVDGDSMYDTLLDNERLFATVLDVKLGGVERDDIVICHYPNRGNTNFVKRIVAVPGDTVYREDGFTHVSYQDAEGKTVDHVLDGDGYTIYHFTEAPADYRIVLGEDEYFAVGDNRYNSHDSRNWNDDYTEGDVGPITGDMIVAKVRWVIWPPNAIRSAE